MKALLIIAGTLFLSASGRSPAALTNRSANTILSCAPVPQKGVSISGKWYLQPVLPSDTAAGIFPTISFDLMKSSFTGNTGCNPFNGTFRRTDSSLVFNDKVRVSKMICTGYNEPAFLKNLLSTNRYELKDSVLILLFNETELSRWTRKPARGIQIRRA